MTIAAPQPTTLDAKGLRRTLAPLLERVAADTVRREQERELLHDDVRALLDLGFGRLRLPAEHGGPGLALSETIDLLIDVATADPNLAHLFRGHIGVVETLLLEGLDGPGDQHRRRWAERIAHGALIGNAQSERSLRAEITTRLRRDGDRLLLEGTKYYTTGSIYADWIQLSALDGDERVGVLVEVAAGVRSVDDWDGFGQPLTGSGTTVFDGAVVDPLDVHRQDDVGTARGWLLAAVWQLVLLAVLAGIARRALQDTVAFVQPRERTFGLDQSPREDPLVQSVVGSLSAAADAAARLVRSGAQELDAALAAVRAGEPEERLRDAMLAVFRLQQIVPPLVLDAAEQLFEVGGASAVSNRVALDRHWRNARTIASHNPIVQRRRALGQWELLGELPGWRPPGAPAAAAEGAGR
ncbi:acyl-CoA dehydrogenase family protein [Arenivirga flava]|uniref:Acyl-CoA dehydrogenase C-terminal domain-containing protein n=1 Tax=Arenivirga flava TaxID=1930060 RepID=A0AA37UIF1_9MICO|nr:acyl-CoA dehydrogenase family protein [Arenivirga flava]GMA27777.1 hypothetical protein GCM10025874_10300 [Arenivirga flava]